MSGWTEPQLIELKKLWSGHLSASQMMEHFPGKTRNAILGKANRMGLPSRRVVPKSKAVKPQKPPVLVVKQKKELPPPPPVPNSPQGPFIPFMEAKHDTCRAIMDGKGVDGLSLFCSNKSMKGYSFCPFHADIFFQKSTR